MKTGFLWAACRPLASALCVFVLGATASAQTVRPVINELVGNPVKGRVEYVNDGLTRLNVVLEARSFTAAESGEISYRPLDPGLHVKSSATSFRIPPQQTYYVFYEAISPQVPAWFVIYANFTGFAFRPAQGNVRLQLPHTICLLPKQSVEKSLHVIRADLDAAQNKVTIEVESSGPNFGRILQTHRLYSNKKVEAPGFPVFPHGKRILEVPLEPKAEGENVPVDVSLELEKFTLEQELERHSSTGAVSVAATSTAAPAGTRGGDKTYTR